MPNYGKGFEVIREELRKRLENILGVGIVSSEPIFERDAPMTSGWKEKYQVNDQVNYWFIVRESDPRDEEGEFKTNKRRVHPTQIHGLVGFRKESVADWDALVDRIKNNLGMGDRTLNLSCLTHTIPESSEYGLTTFMGVNCNAVVFNMSIVEIIPNA